MLLSLETLVSSSIKSQKSWTKLLWLGQEKENLFLSTRDRLRVLYLPSGKTTHKITALSHVTSQLVYITCSKNGHYLVCLLRSGEIIAWHRDSDHVTTLANIHDICPSHDTTQTGDLRLWVSDDCAQLILKQDNGGGLFLWRSPTTTDSPPPASSWIIPYPENIPLSTGDHGEVAVDVAFTSHTGQVDADALCCFVYNTRKSIFIVTLHTHYQAPVNNKPARSPVENVWHTSEFALSSVSSDFTQQTVSGAYITCFSHDASVLAVVANQNKSTTVLFVSTISGEAVVSRIVSSASGKQMADGKRIHWLADIQWLADDSLIVCISHHGSICIMTPLGQLITSQTFGCSVDLGPASFLPLHPLMTVKRGDEMTFQTMGQHYSVTTHPSLPMILCCDGSMVTLLALPAEMSRFSLIRDFILEMTEHLHTITDIEDMHLTLVDAYKLSAPSKHRTVYEKNQLQQPSITQRLRDLVFSRLKEPSDDTLNMTQESSTDEASASPLRGITSGKVDFHFGETVDASGSAKVLGPEENVILHVAKAISAGFSALGLASSEAQTSTRADRKTLIKQILHNMSKTFSVILSTSHRGHSDLDINQSISDALTSVLVLFRAVLSFLQFAKDRKHLVPVLTTFAHAVVKLCLEKVPDKRLCFSECINLLLLCEYVLDQMLHKHSRSNKSCENGFCNVCVHEVVDSVHVLSRLANSSTVDSELADYKQKRNSSVNLQSGNATDQKPSDRLHSCWKLIDAEMQFSSHTDIADRKSSHMQKYYHLVKQRVGTGQETRENKKPVTKSSKSSLISGARLSLSGQYEQAEEAWRTQLIHLTTGGNTSHGSALTTGLHALLYTHLITGNLSKALLLVDNLIESCDIHAVLKMAAAGSGKKDAVTASTTTQQKQVDVWPLEGLTRTAIRKLIQTMSRFMAAYFTNEMLYVLPPHDARPLPSLHETNQQNIGRVLPISHAEVTRQVSSSSLEQTWTNERTLSYLLLSGLFDEAVLFAGRMGDWKASFILATTIQQHSGEKVIEKDLQPLCIMQRALHGLVNPSTQDQALTKDSVIESSEVISALTSMMATAAVCQVDIVPWSLKILLKKMISLVKQMTPLVATEFYLPAPPIYCLQPPHSKQETESPHLLAEHDQRQHLATLVKHFLIVVQASKLAVPFMTWYIQQLACVQEKAAQFQASSEGPSPQLPDTLLQSYMDAESHLDINDQNTSSVNSLKELYRFFLAVLWLVHVRDKLSLHLRTRESLLSTMGQQNYLRSDWSLRSDENWTHQCFVTLQWLVHFLSFTHVLSDRTWAYKVLLSLIQELPASADAADILADYCHDAESLDGEIQERLDGLLKKWKAVILQPNIQSSQSTMVTGTSISKGIEEPERSKSVTFENSPRGKSLALHFLKQCEVVHKAIRKKAKCFGSFDKFVNFPERLVHSISDDDDNIDRIIDAEYDLNVGSLPFESKASYVEFLDTFADVCLNKVLNSNSDSSFSDVNVPLICEFSEALRSKLVSSYVQKERLQSKWAVNSNISHNVPSSPSTIVRSQSAVDSVKTRKGMSINDSGMRRFSSESKLDSVNKESQLQINRNFSGSVPNMSSAEKKKSTFRGSSLVQRFSQSDESLYKSKSDDVAIPKPLTQVLSWDKLAIIQHDSRYGPLLDLMSWLNNWSRKQVAISFMQKSISRSSGAVNKVNHSASMHISVSPELVLLALWLKDKKYKINPWSDNTNIPLYPSDQRPMHSMDKQDIESEFVNKMHHSNTEYSPVRHSSVKFQAQPHSKHSESRDRSKTASQRPSKTKQVVSQGMFVSKTDDTRHKSREMMAQSSKQMIYNSYGLDHDAGEERLMTDAYSVLLNNSESESIGVSSLGSDEMTEHFKNTLSFALTQSPEAASLTRAYNPKSMPSELSSPETMLRTKSSLLNTQTPSQLLSHLDTPSSRNKKKQEVNSLVAGGGSVPADGGADGTIATQLQQVIRGEFSRFLQAQHHSLMAMMSAFDGPTQPPPAVRFTDPHSTLSPSREPVREHLSPNTPLDKAHSRASSKLHEKASPHLVAPAISRALKELNTLKHSTKPDLQLLQRSLQLNNACDKENILDQSMLRGLVNDPRPAAMVQAVAFSLLDDASTRPPRFLRLLPEKDTTVVRLPVIPKVAWPTNNSAHTDDEKLGVHVPYMPLLKLDRGHHRQNYVVPAPHPLPVHAPNDNLQNQYVQEFNERVLNEEQMARPRGQPQLLKLLPPREYHAPPVLPATAVGHEKSARRQRRKKEIPSHARIATSQTQTNSEAEFDHEDRGELPGSKTDQSSIETDERIQRDGQHRIHDGYAITPGQFADYLPLKTPLDDETASRIHMEVAFELEKQRQQRFEDDEPVQLTAERVMDKVVAKQRGISERESAPIIAPNVYLDLRFGQDSAEQLQRGFLNVVDLDASAILHDLEGRRIEPVVDRPRTISPSRTVNIDRALETMPGIGVSGEIQPSSSRPSHVDAITREMFEQLQPTDSRFPIVPYARVQTRESMVRQLRLMEEQMDAIGEMSHNIEQEFGATKRLLRTIEHVGNVIAPEQRGDRPDEQPEQAEAVVKESADAKVVSRSTDTPTPQMSDKSPKQSARTARSVSIQQPGIASRETQSRTSVLGPAVSGLSGITDIIGELLATGQIDAEGVGLESRAADKILKAVKARRTAGMSITDISVEKLGQMASESHNNADHRGITYDREAIQDWMAHQRAEQHRSFQQHRRELREMERHPYQPREGVSSQIPLSSRALKTANQHRSEHRSVLAEENKQKRLAQAVSLLGEIMTDKPDLQKEYTQNASFLPAEGASARISTPRVKSPSHQTFHEQAGRTHVLDRSTFDRSIDEQAGRTHVLDRSAFDRSIGSLYSDQRSSRDVSLSFHHQSLRGQSQQESQSQRDIYMPSSQHRTVRAHKDIIPSSVTQQMPAVREETETQPSTLSRQTSVQTKTTSEQSVILEKENVPGTPFKPKSYTELVRLQNPEATRKHSVIGRPMTSMQHLGNIAPASGKANEKVIQQSTSADKEKLYGSKRIPGTSSEEQQQPRRVKTYTERLQEMKKSRKTYMTPIVNPVPRAARTASVVIQPGPRPSKPLHPSSTYSERLQQLAHPPGQPTVIVPGSRTFVRPKTGMKSHKPYHKPKTYVQQLQQASSSAPRLFRQPSSRAASHSEMYQPAHYKAATSRARPYADPYVDDDDERVEEEEHYDISDLDSVLSAWTVDESVKQLLYGDGIASAQGVESGMTDDSLAGISDVDLMTVADEEEDDNHAVKDVISLSSASSYIDWDAVDRLAATVAVTPRN